MINPGDLRPTYKKWFEPRFAGGKFYIPVLVGNNQVLRARRTFKRASEAQTYADRLLATWKRVYPMFQRMAVSGQVEPATVEN